MEISTNDTKTDFYLQRVIKGNNYCNDFWQKTRFLADDKEYHNQIEQWDNHVKKLQELSTILRIYGFNQCCFGECKWDDEKFLCMGCTKE